MSQKTFATVAALVALIYGVCFLLVPGLVADVFGVSFTPAIATMNRFFGVSLIGIGGVCWAVRELPLAMTRPLWLGLGVSNVAGLIVSVHATITHTLNAMGWTSALVYLVLALGCAAVYRGEARLISTV